MTAGRRPARPPRPSAGAPLTLGDLVLAVQAYAGNDEESVEAIAAVLASGRIRLRPPVEVAGPRIRLVRQDPGTEERRRPRPEAPTVPG